MVFISFVRARRTPGPSLPAVPQATVRHSVSGQKSRSYARPFGPQMIGSYPPERPGGDCASSCRPLPGFRAKKPVICAALWPTDDRLFPRNAPEATVSLYSSCCFRICRHPLSSFSFQKKRVPFHLFLRALNRPLPFRSHEAGQKSLPLLALGTSSSSGISAASSARRHSRFSRGSSYGNSSFPVSRSRSGVNRRS